MEKKSGSFRLFVGVPPGEPVLTVLLQHIERMIGPTQGLTHEVVDHLLALDGLQDGAGMARLDTCIEDVIGQQV